MARFTDLLFLVQVALLFGALSWWLTPARHPGLFTEYGKNRALGRAEALRRAQQALWQESATAHPALWAPFVLVGDGGLKGASPRRAAC